MIKVGFILNENKNWMGGVNYFKNLFKALSLLESDKIQAVVFTGKKSAINISSPNIIYVRSAIFDRLTLPWIIRMTIRTIAKRDVLLLSILKKNKIDILSHYFLPHKPTFKLVPWIPDFQHLHLPEMFTQQEIDWRNQTFNKMIKGGDLIILSSDDALKDLGLFSEVNKYKGRVLHFVSLADKNIYNLDFEIIKEKYGIRGKYFYLPNQFWKHKNHITVFEAVKKAKAMGVELKIICSGQGADSRNPKHFDELMEFIKSNKLEDNISILGMIDYQHVLGLMRNSLALINPSLFEGWSTSVEEAKSLGKNLIVSDIATHREQNAASCIFFAPLDADELVKILIKKHLENNGGPDHDLEAQARANMQSRMLEYANTYLKIINEL